MYDLEVKTDPLTSYYPLNLRLNLGALKVQFVVLRSVSKPQRESENFGSNTWAQNTS